jgi:SAM-dependent methyltransferase
MQQMPWGTAGSGTALGDAKRPLYRSVLSQTGKYCPPPATLLDVGCSFGGFLREARDAGYTVFGCDIIPQAVEHVRSLGIPAEVCFSIGDLRTVDSGSLDVMTCLDCNYYWPNQPFELRSAFAKLRPGGHLIMRVANKSWLCALGLAVQRIAPSIAKKLLLTSLNDHRFSMPLASLLKVIRDTGFEVVHASPRGALSNSQSGWIARLFFASASLVWEASGIFAAPGALVLAKKPS